MPRPAATLLLLASTLAAACASTEGPAPNNPPRPAVVPVALLPAAPSDATNEVSAGDVSGEIQPSMSAEEIAAARAEGPPALERLIAQYESMSGPGRFAVAASIDKVAAQRYATVSRM